MYALARRALSSGSRAEALRSASSSFSRSCRYLYLCLNLAMAPIIAENFSRRSPDWVLARVRNYCYMENYHHHTRIHFILAYTLCGIGLFLALIISTVALTTVSNQQDELRRQSALNCERGNEVRNTLRFLLKSTNEGLRSVTPDHAPSEETKRVIKVRQYLRTQLTEIDCSTAFD